MILKKLKIMASLLIFICFFLPISQCSTGTVVSEIGVKSENFNNIIVLSKFVFSGESDIIFGVFTMLSFLLPLVCSLVPKFKKINEVLKLVIQFLCSGWLVYISYVLIFGVDRVLMAGWLLSAAIVVFLMITVIEVIKVSFIDRVKKGNSLP